ncbi:RnfH family protein [Andreprevotia chitinilytica]|uniref:RnfH family protein n=1 Tax=Andreprevotia chitinilytica TaxID=396808 RepID=UPI000554E858|nr:RnfH family protein [Andreprevotia chitinilytica]
MVDQSVTPDEITVEVVYATPAQQKLVQLRLPAGTTASEAIHRSGLLALFPEIDLTRNKIGIFSRAVKPDAVLRDQDRVEIYRPLIADPKEVRQRRVVEDRTVKKARRALGR